MPLAHTPTRAWGGAGADKAEYQGVRVGLASMRVGERCLLHVDSALAYGDKGHFSFPHIQPHADMVYDVILIGFEAAENVRSSRLCRLRPTHARTSERQDVRAA